MGHRSHFWTGFEWWIWILFFYDIMEFGVCNKGLHRECCSLQVDIHEDFISSCMDRLKASYDTVTVLEKDKDSTAKLNQELTRLCRVLKVLHEYVMECDADFIEERTMIPLFRAPRGKQVSNNKDYQQSLGN